MKGAFHFYINAKALNFSCLSCDSSPYLTPLVWVSVTPKYRVFEMGFHFISICLINFFLYFSWTFYQSPICLYLSLKVFLRICLFIWKLQIQRQKGRERDVPSTGSFLILLQWPVLAQTEARSFIWVSPTWVIGVQTVGPHSVFPRKLDWK